MNKDYLKNLMDKADCGMFVTHLFPDAEILYANEYLYKMFQYTKKEYVDKFGNSAGAVISPDEKQKIKAIIGRQISAGGDVHLEFSGKRKDDSVIWISLAAHMVVENGETLYYCTCLDMTETKALLNDTYKSKKELSIITNNIPGGVIKIGLTDCVLRFANDGFFRLAGYSRAEYNMLFHNSCINLVHPADAEMVGRILKMTAENCGPLGMEYRILAKDGSTRWSYVNGTRVDDESGDLVYLCIIVDITSRKEAERELDIRTNRIEQITEKLDETTWHYDVAEKKLYRSGNFAGTYSNEKIICDPYEMTKRLKLIHPQDQQIFEDYLKKSESEEGTYKFNIRVKDDKSVYRGFEVLIISAKDMDNGKMSLYGVTRKTESTFDIEPEKKERKSKNESRLLKMAKSAQVEIQDNITGLIPYSSFIKKAERMLASRDADNKYALMCADINEFRKFNQHYGFSISNEILKMFSDLLLKHLAKGGLCSRVDGDYFVILFKYKEHRELLKAMSNMVEMQEGSDKKEDYMHYGSTIGVYIVQESDRELGSMLEKADLARRSIKGLAGNHYAVYTDDIQVQKFQEEEIIEDIRYAMKTRNIDINYLPRIENDKDNIIGCKAVPFIIMRDGKFIDERMLRRLMERTAKLEDLGMYVIDEVTKNLGAWKADGNKVIPVSIELTASQLSSPNVVNRINEMVVGENGLDPSDFIFEISERYFAESTTDFEMALKSLRTYGYGVVISRFGSDHMAINSLRRLPISGIKFHGEFFNDHMTSSRDKVIFKKVVELANELGLMVFCGAVHTKLQENFVREIGCGIFEGDVFYGPMKNRVFEKCYLSSVEKKKQ